MSRTQNQNRGPARGLDPESFADLDFPAILGKTFSQDSQVDFTSLGSVERLHLSGARVTICCVPEGTNVVRFPGGTRLEPNQSCPFGRGEGRFTVCHVPEDRSIFINPGLPNGSADVDLHLTSGRGRPTLGIGSSNA